MLLQELAIAQMRPVQSLTMFALTVVQLLIIKVQTMIIIAANASNLMFGNGIRDNKKVVAVATLTLKYQLMKESALDVKPSITQLE
jgi:hypothetical protein